MVGFGTGFYGGIVGGSQKAGASGFFAAGSGPADDAGHRVFWQPINLDPVFPRLQWSWYQSKDISSDLALVSGPAWVPTRRLHVGFRCNALAA